jgi:antitoxin component YwqK of YwqJK toxin-antitoxin module
VNGGKEKEVGWENDELDGSWKEWYMNGQIRVKGSYTKGREHGEWIYWYQNGEKMIEAEIDG